MLLNVLSQFFSTNLSGKMKMQIRLQESELRCLPHMYLIRFLIFCEKNLISPSAIRIFYFDSACSLNENLIAVRFPDFKSNIFFFNDFRSSSIPEIPKNEKAITILMIDNGKKISKKLFDTCDIEIALVSRED